MELVKHYETKMLYVKELVDRNLIKILKVGTKYNIADSNIKF